MESQPDLLDEMREVFERFVREACECVARDGRLLVMWPTSRLRIERSGGPDSGSFSLPTEVRYRPRLTTPGEQRVSTLKTAGVALAQLLNHPACPELLPPPEGRLPDFEEAAYLRDMFVIGFLRRYFSRASGPKYEPPAFAQAFADMSAVLTDPSVEERVLIPLFGLTWSLEGEAIDLGHGVRIRRLGDTDREAMLNAGTLGGLSTGFGLETSSLVWVQAGLDASWRTPVRAPRLSPERFEPAYDAITALRLSAPGGLSAAGSYAKAPFIGWYTLGTVYTPLPYRTRGDYGRYVLSPEGAVSLPKIFNGLRGLNPPDRRDIGLAVERFHRSFDVPRVEERVVDLMIAFDSLLGSKGPGSVQRLSMRLPMYISDDPDERLRLSRLVSAVYGMRSAIVHGGKAAPSPGREFASVPSAAFLAELEDAVRKVLRRAILDAVSGKRPVADVPRFIDEELILGARDTSG